MSNYDNLKNETFNQRVVGSNPAGLTNLIQNLKNVCCPLGELGTCFIVE